MSYLLIPADGSMTIKEQMTLKEMQEFVGGYIEQVGNIFCNEDGIRLNLPRNITHSRFLGNVIRKI